MPSVNLIRLREAFSFPLRGFVIGSILGLQPRHQQLQNTIIQFTT